MKTFKECAAQGDIYIMRVEKLPEGLVEIPREPEGKLIVTHSETGHHHSIYDKRVKMLMDPKNPMVCYLQVAGACDLVHEKSGPDMHEALRFSKGTFAVYRQREYTPQGWQTVQD